MTIKDRDKQLAAQRRAMQRRREDPAYRFIEAVTRDDPSGDNDEAARWLRELKVRDPKLYREVAGAAVKSSNQLRRIRGLESYPQPRPSTGEGDPEDDRGEYADNVFVAAIEAEAELGEAGRALILGGKDYQPENLTPRQKAKMSTEQREARRVALAWQRKLDAIGRGSQDSEEPNDTDGDDQDAGDKLERDLGTTQLARLERRLSFPFRMERDSREPFRSRRRGDSVAAIGPSGTFAACQVEGLRTDPLYSLRNRPKVRVLRVHASTHWGVTPAARSDRALEVGTSPLAVSTTI